MRKRPLAGLVCLYIVFLIGVLVWQPAWGERLFRWNEKEKQIRQNYDGVKEIEGLVLSVQKKTEDGRARIRLADGCEAVLIVSKADTERMMAGSRIQVKGALWWPEEATNPGQWDGKRYARIQNIDFYMRAEDWNIIDKTESGWYQGLDAVRRWLAEQIELRWDEEESQIIKAMLLGDKGELSKETTELYRQGGISHVMAISGLHLTILSEILSRLLKKLQRPKPVQLEVTAFLWFYVLLTGAPVSILRAAIMMSIRSAAVIWEREEDEITTLALTAGILLLIEPLYLLDAGFCLSFAALLGMRYGKLMIMALSWIPYRLRRVLAPSLGITLATLPLSLWFFSRTSVLGFLLNFWVIPMMELLLVGALAALGLSALHPALGYGLTRFVDFLLYTFQQGSHWIAWAQMRGKPELYQLMAFYGLWIVVVWLYRKPYERKRRCTIGLVGLILCGLAGYCPSFWRVTYLDVGQGDCAVIEWKQSTFIVDAGPDYEAVLKPYLLARGVKQIDGVVLSHSDWDHMEGLVALSADSDFSIKRLWIADDRIQENENCLKLEQNVLNQGGSVQRVQAGYQFYTEDFGFTVLSPVQEHSDRNEASLVIQWNIENRLFLFPGDIGAEAEQEIGPALSDVDVLKVAHHGSRYSSTEEFLDAVQPELAIISCGRENEYGHPHEETLSRLEDRQILWLATAERGAVWIEEHHHRLRYRYYRE